MVKINGVSKSFDEKQVLRNVSFAFSAASVSAITGVSGCGKTTLARIILGVEKPDAGTVEMPPNAKLACVFQEDRLIEHLTGIENVRLTSRGDASDALKALGLDPRSADRVSAYSGGMRRRVAIARAVASKPNLLVLDEPFKGLDEGSREKAAKFIRKNCPGACVILITHDPDELKLMGVSSVLNLQS